MITEDTRASLRAALLDETIHLGMGVGTLDDERCTMAAINLVLTGVLDDGGHPCVSEAIRYWVIRIQDVIPDWIRNGVAWRTAAVGIAGSAAPPDVELARVQMLLTWMWDRLADPAVLAGVPVGIRPAWDVMLRERTAAAATATDECAEGWAGALLFLVAGIADAAGDGLGIGAEFITNDVSSAVIMASGYATLGGDATDEPYWERADVPGMLARLVAVDA